MHVQEVGQAKEEKRQGAVGIVKFKRKTTFGPTDEQLITAEDAIDGGNWPWEYQVNVFFRLTGSNVRRADLREFVAQSYPLDRDGNPIDCAAIVPILSPLCAMAFLYIFTKFVHK